MSNTFNTTDLNAYIGIDIGGTNTRIGLFSSLASPDFVHIAKFPTFQSYEEQLLYILQAVTASSIQFSGIGVSIAARIAKDGHSIHVAPNLPDYVDKAFADDLVKVLRRPVRLAHDPVCGLLAERQFGILNKIDRCAYVTVSTGTGAAIHLSKASTSLVSSIEIGHQLLDGNSLKCLCGQVGCLETFTGGRQIELRYGLPIAQITDSTFWNLYADKLAIGLVNLAQLTRIDMVAMSGSIVLKSRILLPMLQEKVSAMLKGSTLELRTAQLGEDAPLVGAAVLFGFPEDHIMH